MNFTLNPFILYESLTMFSAICKGSPITLRNLPLIRVAQASEKYYRFHVFVG